VANYYYVLHSRVMPGVYKVGISNDWRRRFEEHGGASKWELVDQCNVGSREAARRFEQRQLRRYDSRRIRKGCEDLALTEAQLQELREAMREASAPKESKAHLVGSACAARDTSYRVSGAELSGAVTTFKREPVPQPEGKEPDFISYSELSESGKAKRRQEVLESAVGCGLFLVGLPVVIGILIAPFMAMQRAQEEREQARRAALPTWCYPGRPELPVTYVNMPASYQPPGMVLCSELNR
jgi:hypothetical protein